MDPRVPVLFVENISLKDVRVGNHFDCGSQSVLIQIVDCGMMFPNPRFQFGEVFQFAFNDEEEEQESAISDQDASKLVGILQHALRERLHVVVHCVAGLCRSGAVVEVASMMGFQPVRNNRIPNLLVKSKMMKELGWSYE